MGSRAERKQRRLDKIECYKFDIKEAVIAKYIEHVKIIAETGCDVTDIDVCEIQLAHRTIVAKLISKCPQQKELVICASNEFVRELDEDNSAFTNEVLDRAIKSIENQRCKDVISRL